VKQRTVYVYLAGRMGNQLFQVAAAECARSYFGESEVDIVLLVGPNISLSKLLTHYRKLEIQGILWRTANYLLSRSVKLESRLMRFNHYLARCLFILLVGFKISFGFVDLYVSRKIDDLPSSKNKKSRNIVLIGYFQTFAPQLKSKGVESEIRKLVYFDSRSSTRHRLERDSLVLHMRKMDYWNNPDLGVLDQKYYVNAMSELKKRQIHFTELVIVTDDDALSKDSLPSQLQMARIMGPSVMNEFDALDYLMIAPTLIISNSSFAWWGAYLGQYRTTAKREILYPFPWFRQIEGIKKFPVEWIPIQASWEDKYS
jgi:hypothetical protein